MDRELEELIKAYDAALEARGISDHQRLVSKYIGLLRKIAPIDTSKIDFEKARFVHAAKRDLAEA